MKTIYPLGHTAGELERLDLQAQLLRDPSLEELAAKATSCLEIGCGNGSNLPMLRAVNPYLKYTGIDTASGAITAAQDRFTGDNQAQFVVMDGAALDLCGAHFDLVFTKLVLWSVGPKWKDVLAQAFELLLPGGIFHAFEPCNHLVEIYPEKPAARQWMNSWDQAAIRGGVDPFIGTKVAAALEQSGFINVDSRFNPVIAPTSERDRYEAIVSNLKNFYMGPSADSFGLSANYRLREDATAEFNDVISGGLVMDAFYVAWGTKPRS